MRVTLDATPLLGPRTGIARYVQGLLDGLTRLPEPPEIVLTAFTGRGWRQLVAPPGCSVAGRPVPARVLRTLWAHTELPPVEWLTGTTDVFHATNFVLPPTRQAVGVLTVHDLSFLRNPDTVTRDVLAYQRLVARGVRRAAAVVTDAEAVADEVAAEYGIPRASIRATHLGIDADWSATRAPSSEEKAALGLPAEYIVAVGTVEPRKNLPLLVSAHRLLPGAPPLVLVGGARWAGEVAATARVHLTGHVPDEDLRRIVAGGPRPGLSLAPRGLRVPSPGGLLGGSCRCTERRWPGSRGSTLRDRHAIPCLRHTGARRTDPHRRTNRAGGTRGRPGWQPGCSSCSRTPCGRPTRRPRPVPTAWLTRSYG